MRKYIIGASLLLTLMGGSSCSDSFLDLDAPSRLPADEYYTTKERIYEALVAAYGPLQWFDWAHGQYCPLNVMSDILGDDIYPGGSSALDNEFWHLQFNYSVDPIKVMTGLWLDCYTGVRRTNYVMEYMPGVLNIDELSKKLFLAESKVLRAYYYTQLWKFWGAIPYYKQNLTFPYTIAKTPANDIYNGIIEDLEEAIKEGGLSIKQSNTSLNGRVSLAMAYMLYTEVVMYQKDTQRYPQALAYMKEIISSNQYQLTANFEDVWKESGEWNQECIFAINYFNKGASRSWSNPYYAGGSVMPTLISPYGLADGTNGMDSGWGFCPVTPSAFDAFEEGDERRSATINDWRSTDYTPRYQDTGFWLRKYAARSGYNEGQIADAQLNYGNDLRIYRYSETLLNAAELVALGAGAGDAQAWLNEVRSRAGVAPITPTVDNIIQERRIEFMGEGKRYWDLIRSGKASSVLVPNEYRTVNWSPNKRYLPIPQSEINSSDGKLEQYNEY